MPANLENSAVDWKLSGLDISEAEATLTRPWHWPEAAVPTPLLTISLLGGSSLPAACRQPRDGQNRTERVPTLLSHHASGHRVRFLPCFIRQIFYLSFLVTSTVCLDPHRHRLSRCVMADHVPEPSGHAKRYLAPLMRPQKSPNTPVSLKGNTEVPGTTSFKPLLPS